jgi:hypothetical protein
LGASPFLVIIAAGTTAIFLFKIWQWRLTGKKQTDVSRETCTNFLVSLITVFLPLYALDKRFFEIDESMVKADLFVFGGGLASLPPPCLIRWLM